MALARFAADSLVTKAVAYSKAYMSNYDPSHDWNHILRVVALAHRIHAATAPSNPALCLRKITLSAVLHDVGDKKKPGQNATTMVRDFLVESGADNALASEIQDVCLGVSYSSEVKDPARVVALIEKYPELAVVQDADRLDAIGAVGVGRCFTFGAIKDIARGMQGSIDHFDEKLLHIEGMMKTEAGREIAKERTERIRLFQAWWADENSGIEGDLS